MQINILVLLTIFCIIPADIRAADIHISCDYVDWIEIGKSPPGVIFTEHDKFRGNCSENCFMIGVFLTNNGTKLLHTQLKDVIGQAPNIYIGEELIYFGFSFDFVYPIEFLNNIVDLSVFSKYEEAEARASAICSKKPVKYTGVSRVMGSTKNR
jgi:hypothetical protein